MVLAETEDVWNKLYAAGGSRYAEPTLVLFRDAVSSACGSASAASGPFYCPGDEKLYIDFAFFRDLQTRFRDHTLALFKKHGMTNLGYFHATDADKGAANTLLYFLAYPSRDAATASWKNFREDAAWVKARTDSEKDGKIVAKADSLFLKPVDFSAIK